MSRVVVGVLFLMVGASAAPEAPADLNAQRARQTLADALKSSNPETRKEAVVALGILGKHANATAMLLPMLKDNDVPVRLATIGTLVELKDNSIIPVLKEKLEDPVPEVAFAAAKGLFDLNQAMGREALLSFLEGERKTGSGMIKGQYRSMMRMLKTPKTAMVFAVRQGIGFVPVPGIGEGFWALQTLLFDADFSARASVALLLARDHDPETRQALRESLNDKDWSVRAASAHAIALRNETSLREALVPLLFDDKLKVRLRAAAAYLRLADLASAPARRGKATAPKKR